jgi:class 3 adenylate cyclase/tetratricopeptide (TPR) repeat protein
VENPGTARFCAACGNPLEPPEGMPLEVRKTVTVLFCDVTGSTTLGERQDPEQIRRVLARYFQVARDVLHRHGGTVEKFMGDAVMAVFGVPVLHEDDALRALRAAAELRDAIDGLNEELEQVYGIRIAVRIGVNSGEVIAGDTLRGHSFAAGDAINVAQRLESEAEAGEILIGNATCRLARDAIRAEPLGPLTLKGKEEAVEAHRLVEVLPGVLSHTRRFDSPMVGRGRELHSLVDAFERAAAERSCHLFTVLGAAGVGKSRLVREALAQLGDRARLLVGTCLPYGEGITFWPALEVVKQGTGIEDGDSAEDVLAKIRTALGDDDSAALAAERVAALVGLEETGGTAEQGFWGFRKLIEALARERPTVLVFDDVNWGEPHFLDLIEYLGDWVRDEPLLVVCLARPELLDLRPVWGGGKRNATSILLAPLSADESRELLGNLLAADATEDVVARIQRSAEGNPLFVEEMVSMLIDGGYLDGDGDAAAPDLETVPVPASIQVLLASRLDQLSTGERRAIERGAVEGSVFHSGAVEALADDELRGQVEECLAALVRKELIAPHRASFAGVDGFRFRHVLIREAAYEAVPKRLRADLHERYAAWLDDVAGERLPELDEVLGYHLEQAYRHRLEVLRADDHGRAVALRAATRLASAGRRALGKGDAPAAVKLLERASELLSADPPSRLGVLPELGVALATNGELGRAEELLSEAAEAARRTGDRGTALRATIERANVRLISDPGSATEIFAEIEASLPLLEELDDDRTLAAAWTLIGVRQGIWLGRFEYAEHALGRALDYAVRAGDRRQQAEILRNLALAATWGPRTVRESIVRCREILALAAGDRLIEAYALRCIAVLEARLGDFDDARAEIGQARAIFDDIGVSGYVQISLAFAVAEIELLAGNEHVSERELREALETLDRIGERGYRSSVAAFLAEALYRQDRLAEAEEIAIHAVEEAAPDDIWTQASARATRAKVLARGGDAAAESLAREAVDILRQTDGHDLRGEALLALAEVFELEGRPADALEAATAGLCLFEPEGNAVSADRARRFADRAASAITVAEGPAGRSS